MDKIALDKYYGDVIQVDGKCWQFLGVNDQAPTHTSGDVSALFASCEDCLSGVDPVIVPPSGLSLSMGDCHYIYGDPDVIAAVPTSASLNVDDNSSDSAIVWWTHTEGGVEYVITYSQQDFAFTAGGKSISQVTVSASDLSVNDIYTLTDPQSATRRNGLPWINGGVSGLGTAMSYNVTERIIPPEDCCSILGDYFGLFNLNVQPAAGFSNVDEYGGALWYIWKKAETFASIPINTASSAGMDGIGLFLSGLDGYTSRTQFQGSPSSVREVYNATDVTAIFDRLKELTEINGYWDADWDPLASDPIACPILACGTVNGNPTIFMTVSWIDSDTTKSWLGCSWCNGETKELYTTAYNHNKYTMNPIVAASEGWNRSINSMNRFNFAMGWYSLTFLPSSLASRQAGITLNTSFDSFVNILYANSTMSNVNLGLLTAGDMPVSQSDAYNRLPAANFVPNTYTDASNITYSWVAGNNWT